MRKMKLNDFHEKRMKALKYLNRHPLTSVSRLSHVLAHGVQRDLPKAREFVKKLIREGYFDTEQTMVLSRPAVGLKVGEKGLAEIAAENKEKLIVNQWKAKIKRANQGTGGKPIDSLDERAEKPMAFKASPTMQRVFLKAIKDELDGVVSDEERYAADPIAWIKECKPKIENKETGLEVYKPWPAHIDIIQRVIKGERVVIDKSRQTGITTAIMIAFAHQLLYGRPFHAHVVANKETVAIKSILRKAKRALETAELSNAQRARLNLGGDGTDTITYKGPLAENYIMAHAASPDAGHSFDGNVILMDEFTRMPYAEDIYVGLDSMVNSNTRFFGIVSTYNGDGDFFCKIIDEADNGANGFTHIPIDWRVHPARDDAWREREYNKAKSMGKEDSFREQHELYRITSGEQVFDMYKVEAKAKEHKYVGKYPIPGHLYSKGVDQASTSTGDKTVACVIDITVRPCQIVYMEEFRAKAKSPATMTEQKKAFIERIDKEWPGKLYIDGTNEKALASIVEASKKTSVSITAGSQDLIKFDKNEKLNVRRVPRDMLVSYAVKSLEMGNLIIHVDKFPDLYKALKSARKGIAKRRGEKVDYLDAMLLANLTLTRKLKDSNNDGNKIHEVPNTGKMRGIRGRKF